MKSDIKICTIQKPVIPRNNIIKDDIPFFLKTVNKALSAYAKTSRIAIMLDDYFMICYVAQSNQF